MAGGLFKVLFNPSVMNAISVGAGDFGTPTYNIDNTGGFVFVSVEALDVMLQ